MAKKMLKNVAVNCFGRNYGKREGDRIIGEDVKKNNTFERIGSNL